MQDFVHQPYDRLYATPGIYPGSGTIPGCGGFPELLRLIVWLLTGVRLAVQGLGFGLVRAKTLEYRVSTRAVAQGRHGLKTVESIGLNV